MFCILLLKVTIVLIFYLLINGIARKKECIIIVICNNM